MIAARGLTKRYGPVLAVDGLTFDVRPGRVTGFLGPNGAGKPVTELRHSLSEEAGPWVGRRLVLPLLRLLQLLGRQIPAKDDGGVPGGQLAASDGFTDVEFPEHSVVCRSLARDLSEPLVAEHGGCLVTHEDERCQREQADRDIAAPRLGRAQCAARATDSADYPQDGPGCLLSRAGTPGMRCRATGGFLVHRIVWSDCSHETLTRVAAGLGLPEDRLVKAFYHPVPRDPALAADAGLAAQSVIDQLTPYLAKLDAIPEMQTDISGTQKAVAGLQEWLKGMARDVHEVRSRLDIIADVFHQPPA